MPPKDTNERKQEVEIKDQGVDHVSHIQK